MWSSWRTLKADIVDEHYYMNPEWFLSNTARYNNYDRSGPKVFAGEYAVQTAGVTSADNRNNWKAAIAEAAFMTGLERNADVVRMASYAPLMAHAEAWQWKPDAIWFDNLRSYGTPNYYVQRVFASNAGTRIVPVTPQAEAGLYTSASLDERNHELIVKAINHSPTPRPAEIRLNGSHVSGTAKVTTLASADLNAENSFDHPTAVAPESTTVDREKRNSFRAVAPVLRDRVSHPCSVVVRLPIGLSYSRESRLIALSPIPLSMIADQTVDNLFQLCESLTLIRRRLQHSFAVNQEYRRIFRNVSVKGRHTWRHRQKRIGHRDLI